MLINRLNLLLPSIVYDQKFILLNITYGYKFLARCLFGHLINLALHLLIHSRHFLNLLDMFLIAFIFGHFESIFFVLIWRISICRMHFCFDVGRSTLTLEDIQFLYIRLLINVFVTIQFFSLVWLIIIFLLFVIILLIIFIYSIVVIIHIGFCVVILVVLLFLFFLFFSILEFVVVSNFKLFVVLILHIFFRI